MKPSQGRWSARPWIARTIQAAAVLVPVSASVATGWALSLMVPRPAGARVVAWWVGLFAASTIVVIVTERLARRALPLAALYRLSLVFPGRAPSRSRVARRSTSKGDIRTDIADAWRDGLDADPERAAETILAMVTALSTHDKGTRGHSERVRMFTDMIAGEMDLDEKDKNLLRWASLLHDIGKLRVRVGTLNKPDKLSEEEWAEIKRHPEDGVALLGPLDDFFGPMMGAILDHHEKFDGTGYPNGVAGTEISIGARIVAVADAYDTMTASRPYRKSLSPADGRRELAACAGTHFDPAVVRAFMNISIRRLRWTIGPLSWLSQIPVISRTLEVVTARAAGAAISLGSLGGMAGLGVIAPPSAPAPAPGRAVFRAAEHVPAPKPSPKKLSPGRSEPSPAPTPETTAPPEPEPVVPPPSDEPTPTPSPTPTPTPTAVSRIFYLMSSGSGDVPWSAPLPFGETTPTAAALPNYSSDHDGKPGLTIDRSSNGTAETDPKKYQTWARAGGLTLQGPASFSFWSMLENGETGKRGTVHAELLSCTESNVCTTIAQTTIDDSSWLQTPSWKQRTGWFGNITATIPEANRLVLHVTVRDTAANSIMFAYGTEAYPSKLSLKMLSL